MSKSRYLNTRFWKDPYITSLSPVDKLVFVYLLTNGETNIAGVYELSVREICHDTGVDETRVRTALVKLANDNRISICKNWFFVRNWIKHQRINPNVEKGIIRELLNVPPEVLQHFGIVEKNETVTAKTIDLERLRKASHYSYSNLYLDLDLKNKKRSAKAESVSTKDIEEVVEFYNDKIQPKARLTAGARKKLTSRLGEFSVAEIKEAIEKFAANSWQMEHNSRRGLAWFFHSEDRIERYRNLEADAAGIVSVGSES